MSVLISLSPNTELDDIALSLRVLFSPWKWKYRQPIEKTCRTLSKKLNGQQVILTSSGRSALHTALKATGIRKKDEVIVQAFTCSTVPSAVKWVGAKPVFADIDLQTYNLDPVSVRDRITEKTRAIIIQHTFGIPAPIEELLQLARIYNLIVIEDCAHCLGATYRNQPLGTFGDIAIFSFGRDKTISSVHGGAISSKDVSLIKEARRVQTSLPLPPATWVAQQLLHPILMFLITNTYYFFSLGKAFLVLAQKIHLLSKAVTVKERYGAMPSMASWQASPALAILLENQLNKLDRYSKRRKKIASQYFQELHQGTPRPLLHSQPSWLRFPISVANPDKAILSAKKQNIMLGDWYSAPVFPGNPSIFSYHAGSCPRAEYASAHILNLPTYPKMSGHQIKQVIASIKEQKIIDK